MNEKTKEALRNSRLGTRHSEETKKHWSDIRKGKKNSPEARLKISLALNGKKKSPEHAKKVADAHRGEKCNFWQGGVWGNPYSVDWTVTLRRSIRERDKYICQICMEPQGERSLSIHHIDYEKFNCDPANLVSLCVECHAKTNSNREYWLTYFNHAS